jgi:hypothetical protein
MYRPPQQVLASQMQRAPVRLPTPPVSDAGPGSFYRDRFPVGGNFMPMDDTGPGSIFKGMAGMQTGGAGAPPAALGYRDKILRPRQTHGGGYQRPNQFGDSGYAPGQLDALLRQHASTGRASVPAAQPWQQIPLPGLGGGGIRDTGPGSFYRHQYLPNAGPKLGGAARLRQLLMQQMQAQPSQLRIPY